MKPNFGCIFGKKAKAESALEETEPVYEEMNAASEETSRSAAQPELLPELPEPVRPAWERKGALYLISAGLLGISVILPGAKVWGILLALTSMLLSASGEVIAVLRAFRQKQYLSFHLLICISCLLALLTGHPFGAAAAMLFCSAGNYISDQLCGRFEAEGATAFLPEVDDISVAMVTGENTAITVPVTEVKVGSTVLLPAGRRLLVDGVVLSGHGFIDKSAVTGEGETEASVGSELPSGSVCTQGRLVLKVTATHDKSTMQRLARQWQKVDECITLEQKFSAKLAGVFMVIMVLLTLICGFVMPVVRHEALAVWLYRASGVLLLSWAGGTVLSARRRFVFACEMLRRHGVALRDLAALEELGRTKTVVLDKVGTVSNGEYAIEYMECAPGISEQMLLYYAAFSECLSGHPLAKAVCRESKMEIDKTQIIHVREISGKGICVGLKGGDVLCSGSYQFMKELDIHGLQRPCDATNIMISKNQQFLGTVYLRDNILEQAKNTVDSLRTQGVERFILLTPDRPDEAQRITELLNMDKNLPQCKPEEKAEYVRNIVASGSLGDHVLFASGVADEGALQAAHTGALIGGMAPHNAGFTPSVTVLSRHAEKLSLGLQAAKKVHRLSYWDKALHYAPKAILLAFAVTGLGPIWICGLFAGLAEIFGVLLSRKADGGKLLRKGDFSGKRKG